MTVWHWVTFKDEDGIPQAKPHAVPDCLLAGLLIDLRDRQCGEGRVVKLEELYLDLPGPQISEEKLLVHVDGLRVEIPIYDFKAFFDMLSKLKARQFIDQSGINRGTYFKVHAFMRCLVLTPHHRDLLAIEMASRMDEVKRYWDKQIPHIRRGWI